MSIAYDAVGTPGCTTTSATQSAPVTATAGDCIVAFAFWGNGTANTGISATFTPSGGSALSMTAVGSPFSVGNIAGTAIFMSAFYILNVAGSGSVTTTTAVAGDLTLVPFAYSGVGSVGSTLATAKATSTTASLTTTMSAAGHVLVNFAGSSSAFGATNQTSRLASVAVSPWFASVMGAEAPGSASVTFTNTLSSNLWGMVAVDLIPPVTVAPTGITSGETFGSATVTEGAPNIAPSGIPTGEAFGTPAVGNAGVVSPGGIPSAEAFGSDTVTPGAVTVAPTAIGSREGFGTPIIRVGPFAPLLAKLDAGQNGVIQIIGASTTWGWYDDYQTTQFGWAGRLCIALGVYYKANVVVHCWPYPVGAYAYNAPVTIYSPPGITATQTITLWLGAWPGSIWSTLLFYISYMLTVSNPDIVILDECLNEDSPLTGTGSYTANLNSYITAVQGTYCPGAPILVTDNDTTILTAEGAHHVTFAQLVQATLDNFFTGATAPLTPAIQKSTLVSGVWFIDTRQSLAAQATAGTLAIYMAVDQLHPIYSGYSIIAGWWLQQIAPDIYNAVWNVVPVLGIGSGEAFGTPTEASGIAPTGIASIEGFGAPAVTVGPVSVAPTGIPSAEAFGQTTIGNKLVVPPGIPSMEAFGTPSVLDVEEPIVIVDASHTCVVWH